MCSLQLHDMCVGTVDNGGIHHRFFGIGSLFKNIHGQLHHLIAIGRIDKSSIQHTVEYQFQPISLSRQGVYTHKNHFFFPARFLGCLIGSRSNTVIMSIHGINLGMVPEHAVHFYFCRTTFPCSIGFINQFDIRKFTDSSHKSLMPFHRGSRTAQSGKFHHISFPFEAGGNIVSYRTTDFIIIGTNISSIFIRKNLTVHKDNGDTSLIGFFYNRSHRSCFVSGNNQQIDSLIHKIMDIFRLLTVIVSRRTDLYRNTFIKHRFPKNLIIHFMSPGIVAALCYTNTEMRSILSTRCQPNQTK